MTDIRFRVFFLNQADLNRWEDWKVVRIGKSVRGLINASLIKYIYGIFCVYIFLCGSAFYRQRRGGGHLMRLQCHRELEATREKLRLFEERYKANQREQGGDEHVRELSMRSLKRIINQLKEEIARFESRCSLRTNGG